MQSFKTEGIILKRRNIGEADRVLTVFTPYRGKISVLAKGVRRITSRRAGNVELLNRVQIYLHQGKNFLILTEAAALDTYQRLKDDLKLSTYAYHILELVDKLTAENQENKVLYSDLLEVLIRLSRNPRQLLIRAFETKLLSKLGFTSFIGEVRDIGEIRGLLQKLECSSWEEIVRIKISEKEAIELERILRYHVERVIEGQLKSRQFLRKL
ncbi:DNA repair protein RecO [Candidatus Daviesbacteria bacterium RIFCSPLOWO2_02_FULL_38_15]|uniref:DNA repair protein RecO n=1 Tax=Candidatus Daviesbacteria bacterium RIFCSPLOWO2_02_FULL_38_15 TaxID=1797794 RepID=A0A1F5N3K2_9BACT|nr:MAG: DNA repair protein RecO [Candidatus Daviesbacteria bacterium RIFCSPLOWO2_02_FULL_38_15]